MKDQQSTFSLSSALGNRFFYTVCVCVLTSRSFAVRREPVAKETVVVIESEEEGLANRSGSAASHPKDSSIFLQRPTSRTEPITSDCRPGQNNRPK